MKTKKLIFTSIFIFCAILISAQNVKIVVLHTNDTHSQVEPSAPDAVRFADMGGYARRLGVINQIREQEEHVILLDAGDFSQGTPYFNFFKGRVEVKGLNAMNYDAVTFGNHEFDNGMDTLATILQDAKFPMICANYDMSKSTVADMVKPYKIIEKGGVRIGIIGLGVELEGLVMKSNFEGVQYLDPIKTVQKYERILKKRKKCDVIICLSHLGGDSTSVKVNDFTVAHNSKYVDLILGGHSHLMLENIQTKNAKGKNLRIAQMAKSGFYLGRVDLYLNRRR